MMRIKEELYAICAEFVEERFTKIRTAIEGIEGALLSETKSSAGDKHETGRAMLQLEREKAGKQLAEIQNLKAQLSKVDIERSSNLIGTGSLVYTSELNYFIAISAGELRVNHDVFYAISPQTPIGQLLMGNTEGEKINFRQQHFIIQRIC